MWRYVGWKVKELAWISIALRRRLASLLAIPPALMGLECPAL